MSGLINSETEDTVRALYDYCSNDEVALSFKKGDIIKVLTKLPSGWCNGERNGDKGWFPINFVESIDLTTETLRTTFNKGLSFSNSQVNISFASDSLQVFFYPPSSFKRLSILFHSWIGPKIGYPRPSPARIPITSSTKSFGSQAPNRKIMV